MIKEFEIAITPDKILDDTYIRAEIAMKLKTSAAQITAVNPIRRSIDGRPKDPVYRVMYRVYINEQPEETGWKPAYQNVAKKEPVHIIGFGPAGMFAALRLIELGFKPVVFERGKDVQQRRRDLRALMQEHVVNPDSNYCFGEGGAGTYSDGKLYTRAVKRGDVKKILRTLNFHGAHDDILIDAHPHIGSNKLPKVVQSIRETILASGGEVHFGSKLTDITGKDGRVESIVINDTTELPVAKLILATGHSARDIFRLFDRKQWFIEAKSFAVGVRIEHPQELINSMLYHKSRYIPYLPSAPYSLTCQYENSGVFSFCMCPGGIIVPAATVPGEIVLNGMSVSRRDSPHANSGLVVTVDEADFKPFEAHGELRGVAYQTAIEQAAFLASGKTQSAPAQRVTDFLKRQQSASLPDSSYIPGLIPVDLHDLLPAKINAGIAHALKDFDKKLPGYITESAVMAAPETRTSSPVRITRAKETGMHVGIAGIFPCGEGAGYAGGIVSAAMDGELCAEAAARS